MLCVLVLLYMCPHTRTCRLQVYFIYYIYIYIYIMCPRTAIYVSSYCFCVCPHTTKCVLMLLDMYIVV